MSFRLCSSELTYPNVEGLRCKKANPVASKSFRRAGGYIKKHYFPSSYSDARKMVISSHLVPGHIEGSFMGKKGRAEHRRKLEFVRTLLIDNYDSYTYNIYQELSVINGLPPVVVRNDELTWEGIHSFLYEEGAFDNIVISPGPGSPTCPADIGETVRNRILFLYVSFLACLEDQPGLRVIMIDGVCLQLLLECWDIPILGVCLGHQALGYAHGAQIIHASEPIHGRLSEIEHDDCNLFANIPSGRNSRLVVRYHSLVIDGESLPKELIPIAWTSSDDTLSFLETRKFDAIPDACESERLQANFDYFSAQNGSYRASSHVNGTKSRKVVMGIRHATWPHYGVQFHPESVATTYGKRIFKNFREITQDYWLRSSSFSSDRNIHYTASMQVPHVNRLFGAVHTGRQSGKKADFRFSGEACSNGQFTRGADQRNLGHFDMVNVLPLSMHTKFLRLKWRKLDHLASKVGGARNIFSELFGKNKAENSFWLDSSSTEKELLSLCYEEKDFEGLPFNFYGGFIGYMGYNLKVECGAASNTHKSITPDACFFFADNLVVIDHHSDDVYVMSLHEGNTTKTQWLDDTEKKLVSLKGFHSEKSREQYVNDVEKCLKYIKDGESYELCLTTQFRKFIGEVDPLRLFLHLREKNPAPYASWLSFWKEKLCICSSSPERFLRLDRNGVLEAKPIKGTIARGATLEEDERLKLSILVTLKLFLKFK
ncbi:hypothetical protein V6N13_062061 [Hibiscus sabdariffa]